MFNEKEYKDFLTSMDLIEFTKEDRQVIKKMWMENKAFRPLFIKIKNNIMNKMLTEDIKPEFVKWALYTLWYMIWWIK